MHTSYISWYSLMCLITGNLSCGEDIPSIPDYAKYYIIIACTVTVQLPIRVIHGVCYSYTSGGDDQPPNLVCSILRLGYCVALTNLLTDMLMLANKL
jgi:hypothetical protein